MGKLFTRYREMMVYLVVGVMTTAVNWAVYAACVARLGVSVSNGIAWVIAVIFAFLANKWLVFESKTWQCKAVMREAALFVSARVVTGVLEIVLVPTLVAIGLNQTILGIAGMVSKVLVSVLVLILNFLFSKLFIFKRKR